MLGKVLPGGDAYTYLPASVKRFPTAERLADLLRETGFGDVTFKLMGGSIVALHTGSPSVSPTNHSDVACTGRGVAAPAGLT